MGLGGSKTHPHGHDVILVATLSHGRLEDFQRGGIRARSPWRSMEHSDQAGRVKRRSLDSHLRAAVKIGLEKYQLLYLKLEHVSKFSSSEPGQAESAQSLNLPGSRGPSSWGCVRGKAKQGVGEPPLASRKGLEAGVRSRGFILREGQGQAKPLVALHAEVTSDLHFRNASPGF